MSQQICKIKIRFYIFEILINKDKYYLSMNLTKILSLSAIIFGLYILFMFFLNKKPSIKDYIPLSSSNQFHIGCYLTEHNTTHYDSIRFKLQQLKHESEIKTMKQSSLIAPDYIDKKGVEVARNFQIFMNEYNNYKSRMEVNIELLRAVKNAHKNFKDCIGDLDVNGYSQADCFSDWETYLRCKTDLDSLKRGLNNQFGFKDKIAQQMKVLLNKDIVKVASPRNPSEDIEKQFRRKDKQLQDQQRRIQVELKVLSEKISEVEYMYNVAKNQTINARQLYNDCFQHQHEYRLCEELAIQIRKLGHGSIDNLGEKVQKKAKALIKMKQLIQNSAKDEGTVELSRILEANMKDFRKLYKFFWQSKATILRKCGCTDVEQKKLKQTFEQAERQQQLRRREMVQIQHKQKIKGEELMKIRTERKNLLDELENKLKKLNTYKPEEKINAIEILSDLQRQSDDHEKNILDLKRQFNDLDGKCARIRNRLAWHIGSISKINDCLNKFQYYNQLKRRYERESPKEVKMSDTLKRKLSKSVEEFII